MTALHNCSAQRLLDPASGLVAEESVDLVLTDPPYIIAKKSGFAKGGDKRFNSVDHNFGAWDRGEDGAFTMADLSDVVGALPRRLPSRARPSVETAGSQGAAGAPPGRNRRQARGSAAEGARR